MYTFKQRGRKVIYSTTRLSYINISSGQSHLRRPSCMNPPPTRILDYILVIRRELMQAAAKSHH